MSKRGLTPHNFPPPKRLHTIHPSPQQKGIPIVDVLSDELVLSILSHLSWVDLCVTQLINKNWARLALDNQLWKNHYILTFGKPRLRGARGPSVRSDGREVKSLPSRARPEDSAYKDWKWMFRVSSNWRKGLLSQLLLYRFLTWALFRAVFRRRIPLSIPFGHFSIFKYLRNFQTPFVTYRHLNSHGFFTTFIWTHCLRHWFHRVLFNRLQAKGCHFLPHNVIGKRSIHSKSRPVQSSLVFIHRRITVSSISTQSPL